MTTVENKFSNFKQIQSTQGNLLNFQVESSLTGTINFVAINSSFHIVSKHGAHIFRMNSTPSLTKNCHSELIEEMYKFVQAGDSLSFSREMVSSVIDYAHKHWVATSSSKTFLKLPNNVRSQYSIDEFREIVRSLTIDATNKVLDTHPNPYGFERIMEESYVEFYGMKISIFKQDGNTLGESLYEELGSCHKYDPVFQHHIEALHWVVKSLGETRTSGLELLLCRA
ncbi:hypothetical protein QTV43_000572 [Vibrio vulnificus]|nr:hypothetical protein [Vibrio vulnificus]